MFRHLLIVVFQGIERPEICVYTKGSTALVAKVEVECIRR